MSDARQYDEQLPWLQPVEDEEEPRGLSARKMLAALIVVLFAAAIVGGTFFWLGQRDLSVSGPPELIHAPAGPYKVKPPNPGGLDISSESETAFETSAGEESNGQLDTSKLPKSAEVTSATEQANAVATEKSVKAPETADKTAPAKASGGTGSVIQLGAFANQAQAERAWTSLSTRFPAVAAMSKMIMPFAHGFRLRAGAASPADANQACQTLKAAGENCFVAQ